MKGFWGLVGTLVITIIGGLIVAAYQKPIEQWAQGTGLHAELIAGPWAPYPKDGKMPGGDQRGPSDNINGFARLTLKNTGPSTVTDVRIRFTSGFSRPDIYVPAIGVSKPSLLTGPKEVRLPNFKPGDETTLLLWNDGGFGWPSFLDDWETYSSEGPFSFTLRVHPVDGYGYDPTNIILLLLDYRWVVIALLVGILAFILIVGLAQATFYTRKLLKDQSFYLEEAGRFERDGEKKFQPDLKGLG